MAAVWPDDTRNVAEAHVAQLARRLRTRVYFTSSWQRWQAHPTTRQVWVPELTRPVHYLVALHELGHIGSTVAIEWSDRYGELGPEALVEGAAWAWATMVARPDLVDTMVAEDWIELAAFVMSYLRAASSQEPPRKQEQPAI